MIGAMFAAVLLCALAIVLATGSSGGGVKSATASAAPDASPPQVLSRHADAADAIPAQYAATFAHKTAPGEMVNDVASARRLPTPPGFDAWIMPASMQKSPVPDNDFYCVTVFGPKGPGGSGCIPAGDFGTRGVTSVSSGGAKGAPGYAPHEAVIAGVAPNGVTSVDLRLADGTTTSQDVRDGAFFFDTTADVVGLDFHGPGSVVSHRIDACQACD